jgi:WhiB family redox-sensing transcriptional regulator
MPNGQPTPYARYEIVGDLAWQDGAACTGLDPAIFFPTQGEDTRPAKDVCKICDVQADCLEYALKYNEKFGIWGGASERERRRILRRRAQQNRRERQRVEAASLTA